MLLLPYLITFLLLVWYYWRKISPYFSFPAYTVLTDWRNFRVIFQGKIPKFHFVDGMLNYAKKYERDGMIVVWIPEPILIIYSPETIKFFSNEMNVIDKSWIYGFLGVFLKDGPITSNGLKMKKQRKLLGPAFYPSMMKSYATTMLDHADRLVLELTGLKDNTTNDIHKILEERTLLLFFDAVLGIKSDSVEGDSRINNVMKLLVSCMDFVPYRLMRPWLHFDILLQFFEAGKQHLKMVKELDLTMIRIVEDMKKSFVLHVRKIEAGLHPSEDRYRTLGDALIEQHLRDPSYTLLDIRSDILMLILGGYDTITHTLMWALWLLGMHQDVQERAYEEITAVIDGVIQHENARQMIYLECIIKEILRLYPAVPAYGRKCKKDLNFRQHFIPKGTTIVFLPFLLHRNSEVFTDPKSFNPDRFYANKDTVKPWTLVPFAEGIRSCIGKNYAMLDMKIVLAQVIRSFKIVSLTPEEYVKFRWEALLKSSKPLSVKFIPR